MKLHKFLAISLVAVAFSSCQSGEEISAPQEPAINTASGVVVSMESAELFVSEDQQGNAMSNIPVVLTGEANGAVKVTVKVVADEAAPAVEGENFVVTSKSIIIPEGQKSANVQFYPKGDDEINDNREFTVAIESVEGAEVGANKTTLVTLRDNESFIPTAYQALQGVWKCVVTDQGTPTEDIVEIVGVEEGEEGFNSELTMYGFLSSLGLETEVKCTISCDGVTGAPILIIPRGQKIGQVQLQGMPGIFDMVWGSATSNYVFTGSAFIPSNVEVTEMYLEEPILICVWDNTGANLGYLFWYDDIKLTR